LISTNAVDGEYTEKTWCAHYVEEDSDIITNNPNGVFGTPIYDNDDGAGEDFRYGFD